MLALVAPMLLVPVAPAQAAATAAAHAAADGPGALAHFGLARKDCVGTAAGRRSKVWYTVAGGVLSDVYSPTIDNTNVETMQFVVTDGRTFTDLQTRDTTYTVRALDRSGMACEVTSTARDGRYRLVTDYVTDPPRDAVVMRSRLRAAAAPAPALRPADGSVNGNGGGGGTNGGADYARDLGHHRAGAERPEHRHQCGRTATTRCPTAMALRADRPFLAASSGYAGTASDGLTQLDQSTRSPRRTTARPTATWCRPPGSTPARTGHARPRLRPRRRRRGRRPPAPRRAPRSPRPPAGTSRAGGGYDAGLRKPPGRR